MVGPSQSPLQMDTPDLLSLHNPPTPNHNSKDTNSNTASGSPLQNYEHNVTYTKVKEIEPTSRNINLVLRLVAKEPAVQCGGNATVDLLELIEVRAGIYLTKKIFFSRKTIIFYVQKNFDNKMR